MEITQTDDSQTDKTDKTDDSHCYLEYFKNYNRIHPLTGENLESPNTHDHEGYGHGPFELLLLSIFFKLIYLDWSNRGFIPLSEIMARFEGELRTQHYFRRSFCWIFL
jgi:hypothetical protein